MVNGTTSNFITTTLISLRCGPSAASSLGPWVRIPLKPWMVVCVFLCCAVLCTGRGLATGRSLIQGVLPNVYRSSQRKAGTCSAQALEERVVPSIPVFKYMSNGYCRNLLICRQFVFLRYWSQSYKASHTMWLNASLDLPKREASGGPHDSESVLKILCRGRSR
ncbi:hypothetical protein L798_07486 [Zootermopsis nevadensis]|uniref:Uncharacterized protein n=1 Tax=Zootermopsis nevadensis TaxID=136037 RepID=A0A067RGV2_ZOONE|nr:hypothetical protein L798_07486 [Zootermopsis nevadensis]